MRKSLIALAFGTLGLGIAEFGMMSILSAAAAGFNISISKAGHFISAYGAGRVHRSAGAGFSGKGKIA